MNMNPCPFCGETTRLGVVTKWLRSESYYAKRGAYCRCKACHARGPLVSTDEALDMRNDRPSVDGKKALIELAVEKWNGACRSDKAGELFDKVDIDGKEEEVRNE